MKYAEDKPMTPEEIADTCETTADLLEGNWTQGRWLDEGRMCIEGALAAALDFEADLQHKPEVRSVLAKCPVYTAIVETINLTADDCNEGDENFIGYVEDGDLPTWNDRDYRTEQEVLDILHLTAKRVLGVEV